MFTIIIYGSYLLMLISEIVINRTFRSTEDDKKDQDKKSISKIWVTICLSIILSIFLNFIVVFPMFSDITWNMIGVAIIILGLLLRFTVIYMLGRFFTVDVTIRKDHQLKVDGIFQYIRHPSYAASLLSFLGMAISFNNWISFFVLLIPITWSFINRMDVEEDTLKSHFGAKYDHYIMQTKRLIPYVY